MPVWSPLPEWKGQSAIIVGGGHSLLGFDFSLLVGKNTIGCNHAYQLGPDKIKIVLFGDPSFWEKNRVELSTFPNRVVTCAPSILRAPIRWLYQMRRIRDGIHEGPILGWNYSTGAAAVNLAITLGAHRIFLLGFDMGARPDGRSHWHEAHPVAPRPQAYTRFIRGFHTLAASAARYPHIKIFNVTDGSSLLPVFPRMDFPTFQKEVV